MNRYLEAFLILVVVVVFVVGVFFGLFWLGNHGLLVWVCGALALGLAYMTILDGVSI